MHQTGSFKYAAARANAFVSAAKKGLDVLPKGEMRDLLYEVAEFVLSREL